jgi:hypothetical protein
MGKTLWELPYIGMTEDRWAQHKTLLRARQPFRDFVLKLRDTKGTLSFSSISGAPLFDANGIFKG